MVFSVNLNPVENKFLKRRPTDLRGGKADPAQPLVLHHGLVVPPSLDYALAGPNPVPLLHVPGLTPESVRRQSHCRTPVVNGHDPTSAGSPTTSAAFLPALALLQILETLPGDLKDGQTERPGLPRSRLRGHKDVTAAQDHGDCLGLNVSGQASKSVEKAVFII